MKYAGKIVFVVCIIIVCGAGYLLYRKKTAAAPPAEQQQAMPVTVDRPVMQDVVNYNHFTGNLASIKSVDIRARVSGYLKRIAFENGAFVKKGDLLFEIEPDTYIADRDRAQAAMKSAQAELERASQDYERMIQAVKSSAVSEQEVGTYKAQRDMAEAALLSAKAELAQAKLNLSYTRIESPIDGKISRNYIDEGNLVGSGENTLLANVVRMDPLYIYFNASESEYLNYTKNVRENMADTPSELPVFISLANEEDYGHEGHLDYMDNKVDTATGTIQIRGVIPNPDHQLYPGMFVKIRVPIKTVKDAVLIPQKAIMSDLGGKYVLILDENNILQRRDITLGAVKGKLQVVTSGLDGSETFATGSFYIIRQGMPITPIPEHGDATAATGDPQTQANETTPAQESAHQ